MRRPFSIASALMLFASITHGSDILVLSNAGDPAPDGDGTMWPVGIFGLNEGAAAYVGMTTGNIGGESRDSFLATATSRGVDVVFREGDAAPQGGTFTGTLGQISVNTLGRVAFIGGLTGTAGGTQSNEGIFSGNGTSITQIARENQIEPRGGPGVLDSFGVPTINQSGQVAFWAAIRNTGTPLGSTHGIFIGNGGALTQVARTYTAAPDGNGQFSGLGGNKISNSGNVAFRADLIGTTGGSADNSGIFMGNGTSTTTIARENQLSPDGNGRLADINFAWINDNNKVAFYTSLRETSGGSTDNNAIFRGSGNGLTKIARTGDAAPGGLGVYTALNNTLSINTSGDVAFTAYGSTGGQGVFWGDGTKTETIALSGQTGPDGGYTYTGFLLAAINKTRTVAFQADLSYGSPQNPWDPPGSGTNARGLYLGDGVETLLIAKTGDQLDGSTITQIGFDPKAYTDFQELAFQATLQDGRMGIYLFSPKVKWRHNGSGNWDDASRWTVSLRPGQYTAVDIDPTEGGIVSGPTEASTIRSLTLGLTSSETAELNLKEGDLTILEGASIGSHGKLSGNGRIIGNLVNGGHVSPGNSPGNINIEGNYIQLEDGLLTLEIGGTDTELYDQLTATGSIALGGTFELTTINGFILQPGMTFDLLRADSISFDDLTLLFPNLAEGFSYQSGVVSQGNDDVYQVTVVPEPSPATLILAGMALFGLCSRRHRRAE